MSRIQTMVIKADNIISFSKVLDNPFRIKILNLCFKKSYTITELQKKLEVKSYKNVYEHIKVLENAGFITAEKQMNVQGKAVRIKADPRKYMILFWKAMKKDFKEALHTGDPELQSKLFWAFDNSERKKLSDKELAEAIDTIKELGIASYLMYYADDFNIELELTKQGMKRMSVSQLLK